MSETQQNAVLYKEVAIVLSALGRNKLRSELKSKYIHWKSKVILDADGSRRLNDGSVEYYNGDAFFQIHNW